MPRWFFICLLLVGLGWVAYKVPIEGKTVWERLTHEADYVKGVAEGVEKEFRKRDSDERLRPEEREEVRKVIRGASDDSSANR